MRIFLVVLFVWAAFIALPLCGQQAAGQKKSKPVKILRPTVYLGKDRFCGGNLKKAEFDGLLASRLYGKDSSGNNYKVVGFDINYAERRLYEDPEGNMVVMTDYTGNHFFGDSLSQNFSSFLAEHSKSGDTAFFDNVLVVAYDRKTKAPMPDSTAFLGKSFKVILTK